MTLSIEQTSQFKKDLKTAKKQGKNLQKLEKILRIMVSESPLPANLRDHRLIGNWNHHRELHIEPDWLLIYRIIPEEKIIILVRLGSHSGLFH